MGYPIVTTRSSLPPPDGMSDEGGTRYLEHSTLSKRRMNWTTRDWARWIAWSSDRPAALYVRSFCRILVIGFLKLTLFFDLSNWILSGPQRNHGSWWMVHRMEMEDRETIIYSEEWAISFTLSLIVFVLSHDFHGSWSVQRKRRNEVVHNRIRL